MFETLKAMLPFGRARTLRTHEVPDGMRLYAVGDVHGHAELLNEMIGRMAHDNAERGPADTHVVFLGDYVDRGPDSAAVLELLSAGPPLDATCHFLKGNHEDAFVRVLDGDAEALREWLRFGGRETLQSYGVSDRAIVMNGPFLRGELAERVPQAHRGFLNELHHHVQFGDYVFVHAGLRPKVPLAKQDPNDLMWIRAPFLDYAGDHGFTVVHGHTVTQDVHRGTNRIGIDTGAYRSGRLSAIGLEGSKLWFLEASTAAFDQG